MCWQGLRAIEASLAPGSMPGPLFSGLYVGAFAVGDCGNNSLCEILMLSRLPGLGNTGARDLSRCCVRRENRLFLLLCCALLLVDSLGWLWQELTESRGWAKASKATPQC